MNKKVDGFSPSLHTCDLDLIRSVSEKRLSDIKTVVESLEFGKVFHNYKQREHKVFFSQSIILFILIR